MNTDTIVERSMGFYIWIFFHTFANKIKEDFFIKNIFAYLNFFKIILEGIPCNICKEEVIKYLEENNFLEIKTKNELEIWLFEFHNLVNKKLGHEIFFYEDLKGTYDAKNLYNVLNELCINNINYFSQDIIDFIKKWCNEHKDDFII